MSAATDCIVARRQGASREAAAGLRRELEVLTAFTNSLVGLRLPQVGGLSAVRLACVSNGD